MSQDGDDDLELQALQRQLDDAFQTTRPRPGFDDELWLRMQSSRPAPGRLRDAFAGLFEGIRAAPAVPLSAVAAVLVVVIFVAALTRIGSFGPGGGAGTGANSAQAPADRSLYTGSFGRLPTPVFAGEATGAALPAGNQASSGAANAAPVQYTWTGRLNLTIPTAPVFRYYEPSTSAADQFATGLGAVLLDRPAGFLGSYSASDYTLKVRGTVQSPPSSPAYFIFSSTAMPASDAAGAGPADQANIFLAQHSLIPQWSYTVEVDSSSDPVKVVYEREFDVAGYGPAYVVDIAGQKSGLEVDLSANRPVLAKGPLPVGLEVADYRLISADDAVRAALASGSRAAAGSSAAPTVNLTQAELVYVLVPAGDHSFYEPAILFTGSLTQNGQTQTRRVLVPAVDPSQRTP